MGRIPGWGSQHLNEECGRKNRQLVDRLRCGVNQPVKHAGDGTYVQYESLRIPTVRIGVDYQPYFSILSIRIEADIGCIYAIGASACLHGVQQHSPRRRERNKQPRGRLNLRALLPARKVKK
jgi:hypothetical protein